MGMIFHETARFLVRGPGVFVEIGSDRGEGSTQYFLDLARQHGSHLHTVDLSDQAKKNMCQDGPMESITWHIARGSDWAENYASLVNEPICCLYLDNFDYIWNTVQVPDWIRKQQQEYLERFNIVMDNQNCQVEHLRQMMSLMPWMTENSVVVCDDTYLSNGCWIGKCGGVVLYLLTQGYRIATVECQPGHSYGVILRRG